MYTDAIMVSPKPDGTVLLTFLCAAPASPDLEAPHQNVAVARLVVTLDMARRIQSTIDALFKRLEAIGGTGPAN